MLRSVLSKTGAGRSIALLPSACSLATAGTLALIGTVSTAGIAAAHACSNATLRGTYTLAETGWSVSPGGAAPISLAGFDVYDGAGTGTGAVTVNANGVVIYDNTPVTSTYTISEDCTGTIVFNVAGNLIHFNVYVSPSGDQLRLVRTDPGIVISETETRVSRR
ncbi:MAG: hypothetical protein JO110_01030 [Acetobacteraceae bacterium]|nr:hypothetical protein [Acetobacteraceae bacterium]